MPPPPMFQIYIRSDGNIDPSTVPIQRIGNIYTFTGDLTNSTIEVERDNTVIDGAGFTLQGYGVTGITLTNRSNIIIQNINFRDYTWSVSLTISSNVSIYDNNMMTDLNILLDSSVDNQIIGNNITGQLCISFEHDSSNNMIIANSFYESGGAALYTMDGTNNKIYLNNFIDNSHNVLGWVIGREGNFWDNMTHGNFWSDYQGVDADGDCLGDTPYLIQGRWLDKHPLMAPFNISSITIRMPEWANPPATQEPFPTIPVLVIIVASVVVAGAGILLIRKRGRGKSQ
jgi:nitrous oxidase accessory protein NosD